MGMGTPQTRWRLMHQSLRSVIMEVMRSLPQSGFHWMASQAFTAASSSKRMFSTAWEVMKPS